MEKVERGVYEEAGENERKRKEGENYKCGREMGVESQDRRRTKGVRRLAAGYGVINKPITCNRIYLLFFPSLYLPLLASPSIKNEWWRGVEGHEGEAGRGWASRLPKPTVMTISVTPPLPRRRKWVSRHSSRQQHAPDPTIVRRWLAHEARQG